MSKNLLKIATLIMIIGLSLSIIGFIVIKGNVEEISSLYNKDYLYEEKEFLSLTNEAKDITIDVANRSFVFSESDDQQMKITYFDSEEDYLTIKEDDLATKITNTLKDKLFTLFKWTSIKTLRINIELPKNFQGNITIKSLNGSVSFSNINQLKNLNITTTNSSLSIVEVGRINKLEFNTVNGIVVIKDSIIDDILLTSTNGSNNLKNVTTKKIDISTTNGSIDIELKGNSDEYKITTHTVNGKITFNDFVLGNGTHQEDGMYPLVLSTVNGSIKIKINR